MRVAVIFCIILLIAICILNNCALPQHLYSFVSFVALSIYVYSVPDPLDHTSIFSLKFHPFFFPCYILLILTAPVT